MLSKFVDDAKLARSASTVEQCNSIQLNLDSLLKWAEDWQMSFNIDKCKIMHIGSHNLIHEYKIIDTVLQVVQHETDLEVIVQDDWKVSMQCAN